MALPQRRDPDERQAEMERDVERRRIERETAAGGLLAWWWLWLLIIIAIIWFGGWGWGGYGGWWGWGAPRNAAMPATQNGAASPQVSGPAAALLNATDKQAFVGRSVTLNSVQVKTKVNDHILWIDSNNTTPMLAVLAGADNTTANANVGEGDWVDVIGIVQKAPPAAQAQKEWGLDNDAAKRLEQQGAYLQATQVQKVPH